MVVPRCSALGCWVDKSTTSTHQDPQAPQLRSMHPAALTLDGPIAGGLHAGGGGRGGSHGRLLTGQAGLEEELTCATFATPSSVGLRGGGQPCTRSTHDQVRRTNIYKDQVRVVIAAVRRATRNQASHAGQSKR